MLPCVKLLVTHLKRWLYIPEGAARWNDMDSKKYIQKQCQWPRVQGGRNSIFAIKELQNHQIRFVTYEKG